MIGTELPGLRTFGYRRQATLLVQYATGEMIRVARMYIASQDWLGRPPAERRQGFVNDSVFERYQSLAEYSR